MSAKTIIRLVVSAALLAAVYRETGPWTAAAFALLFIHAELVGAVMKREGLLK